VTRRHLDTNASAVEDATAPACWLLEAAIDGVVLTQTHALARAVVQEAAERWPAWWAAELFGPPHREADLPILGALHEGLRRLRLVRRRGQRLQATARGRELVRDPGMLLELLASDLGGDEPFTEAVAAALRETLAAGHDSTHDELVASVLEWVGEDGWHDADGRPPTERDVSWIVGDVLRRGEAYGLIECQADPEQPRRFARRIALSEGGRALFGGRPRGSVGSSVLVFDAELVNVPDVTARLAVGAEQQLTALHDAIQNAFGWWDDHLYSFWLSEEFWAERDLEFTTPDAPDEGVRIAEVALAELGLDLEAKISYVFDFGDEWRVRLTLRGHAQPDGGTYPRVLERQGTAPPQYPGLDED
jgi:Plasmid pRiA4b ORF-3-like protein